MAAAEQKRTSQHRSKTADKAFRQDDDVHVSSNGALSISTEAIFSSPNVQRDFELIAKLRSKQKKSKV